ncbi:hypothetical protein Val02_52710 [Virgisporangium aliadipatigenens]|uniref:Bacterial transcriptional activator domain-containing protein n=1 Tax=Virgisporangium aliadipatigenens TaxID=741659 RepID=A0A8J4DRQ3_9ACTN|nr:BTAD domain-containing putative transcriptional regulator [Virgisporangium aliadipatigenens]GIJ48385.1 hypothetical protein Val02_52710 [Virgisporangium aliadipatigenens]
MLTIRLLGPPSVARDGRPLPPPRGRKAWALLAYLLLTDRPPSRKQLAGLLFGDAADPLGALRWTLAELRRALQDTTLFRGDPIDPRLPASSTVDIDSGSGELLEGADPAAGAAFESWLLVQRHSVAGRVEARLRQEAVALLAAGRAADAVAVAERVVARNPLAEGNHELLVRCLAMAGDRAAALRQVAVAEDTLRRELSAAATPALRDAAAAEPDTGMLAPFGGRAAALSQLEAGRAAIAAGAVDAGLQCLRRAVSEAGRCRDTAVRARALAALGSALVHAVRGRDEEGAVLLQEAARHAVSVGDAATAAAAYRELGFVEVQAGRRHTAEEWLARASDIAASDAEHAAILGVRGMNASDTADYPAAFGFLAESVARAARAGDVRQQAFSLALAGRAHLLRAERSQAAAALSHSMELVEQQRWIAFAPFPQILKAELDMAAGDLDGAADRLERSWTTACQLDDPCWEGLAARALGLLNTGRGDRTAADRWLAEARLRSNRVPDRYQWIHAHVLDTAAGVALDRDEHGAAARLTADLGALAARADMRELVVRAQLHRYRLGDSAALEAARLLAADIDNPALQALLTA